MTFFAQQIAYIHSTSLRLRDHFTITNAEHALPTNKECTEKEASDTVSLLLKEHLFEERSNLVHLIMSLVSPYTKEKLEGSIASSSIDNVLNIL